MRCPDENELAEYVDNVLDAKQRRVVDQHLDACATCRTLVSDLARMQHAADEEKTVADAPMTSLGGHTTLDAIRQRKRTAHIVAGTMIGEYEVTRVLGAGGMGIVFGAIHPRIGKRAAIKILQRDLAGDETAIVRFENEARAVNAIGHPNIVDIFAFGELPSGDPYYVMEHVDGKSLHEWIYTRGPVSLHRAMPILSQICDALTAAHQRGIIHRDLKPGNIMIAGTDDAPRVKVLDFGLAKMVHYDDELTSPGIAIGTPAFMSPEQFMGKDVDQRTDVYALGVIVYQMLTGTYPFQGETPSAIGNQHLFHKHRLPSKIVDLPERVDQIIDKALAKDVAQRYATVADLRRDLEQCLNDLPTPRATRNIASPAAPPDEPTLRDAAPAKAPAEAPTVVAAPKAPTPAPVVAAITSVPPLPVKRPANSRWIMLGVASAIVGVAIVVMVANKSNTPSPAARVDDVQPAALVTEPQPPVAEQPPPAQPPAPQDPAPVVTDPKPTTVADTKPATTRPTRKTTRTTKSTKSTKTTTTAKGSAAVDDDRMLLEGGTVAPKR